MENFFYDDRFCSDLSDLMDIFDIEEPKNLKDDWTCKVGLSQLEPIFKVDAENLLKLLCYDNEERIGEDFDEKDEAKILISINKSVDFNKLKELLPQYYYPTSKFEIITKADLIEYVS